jgi:hypothetical protein
VVRPRIKRQRIGEVTRLIQKFMIGYAARRKVLKLIADKKIQNLYDEFHRIDIIMKANFQRRVRRAWLSYKIVK